MWSDEKERRDLTETQQDADHKKMVRVCVTFGPVLRCLCHLLRVVVSFKIRHSRRSYVPLLFPCLRSTRLIGHSNSLCADS